MSVHLFGIRHHGPGCARSLKAALEELQPDLLVLEGPADAEGALPLAASQGMQPPVAMLVYDPDQPRRAVYYPLAEFSPEWQALRWALGRGIAIRLMDLPQSHLLAMECEEEQKAEGNGESAGGGDAAVDGDSLPSPESDSDPTDSADTAVATERSAGADNAPQESSPPAEDEPTWQTDPLALLAEAAGYKDHELWWEQQIERRTNAAGLFQAILEAMRTVREETGAPRERDLLREAYMRKTLRRVVKEGFQRIAVVCGAWHAPVLDEEALSGKLAGCAAKEDEARLKGLKKCKTLTTWIPWTYSRLTYRSGYGAGVSSPGWYAHLWQSPSQATVRWATSAARLLRGQDLDASSASVIEVVRLADALAAMRSLRSPGLAELSESILTVLCHGDQAPLQLIRRRLEIGDVLGEVPAEATSTPLAADLAEWQRRLRLKPSTEIRPIDLDVRKENDLAKSHLLHRLGLLGIPWGTFQQSGGRVSTFHEIWQLQWKPEFAVAIIEANVWGNTLETAATAKTLYDADQATELPAITAFLDASILSGLTAAIDPLLTCIQAQAAIASDVRHLLEAILPLARVARYGDVRGTESAQVVPILIGMFERAVVGLAAACSSLDDDAAARMIESIGQAHRALDILDRADLQGPWQDRLRTLMNGTVHGLLRGWCCRLLLEKGVLDDEELYRVARLALSPVNPPAECAAWATGLLKGSGLLLLHQEGVWKVFDRWLSELSAETFVEMLPLLRRAFADFAPAERRQMAETVKRLDGSQGGSSAGAGTVATAAIDMRRAKLVLPVLAHILGVPYDTNGS
jgi:hypothetical protein